MGSWISYTLVSGIILSALYLAYDRLLAADNQPRFNRIILLACYAIAATLPLLDLSAMLQPAADAATSPGPTGSNFAIVRTTAQPAWHRIAACIYLSGVLAVTIMTVWSMLKLYLIVRRADKHREIPYTVAIVNNSTIIPFSWLNYIVMNRTDYRDHHDMIISHEAAHIRCHHNMDLYLARVFEILMWYNPVVWLMASSLRSVHEYEADRAVIHHTGNPKEYQLLLLKKAAGRSFPVLANSLNHSNLKKRITMMLKPESRIARRTRAIALAPIAVAALLCANIPVVAHAIDSVSSITLANPGDNKVSKKSADKQPVCYINGKLYEGDIRLLPTDSIKRIDVMRDPDIIYIEMYRPGDKIPESANKSDHNGEIKVISIATEKKDSTTQITISPKK